jgi:AcrR family transcriptional regulator
MTDDNAPLDASPILPDQARSPARRTPSQERSRETFEAICSAAGAILAEGGITALNTNAVARRAGVSITAVYAYFPDKWAIVQELLDRFERLRTEYLEEVFAELRTTDDWRAILLATWRALVRFRVDVPGGIAQRRGIHATPRMMEIERAWSDRAARDFAATIRIRRPDIDEEEAHLVAWAVTVAVGAILDDVCATGEIDEERFETAARLMLAWFAPYLDPSGA